MYTPIDSQVIRVSVFEGHSLISHKVLNEKASRQSAKIVLQIKIRSSPSQEYFGFLRVRVFLDQPLSHITRRKKTKNQKYS